MQGHPMGRKSRLNIAVIVTALLVAACGVAPSSASAQSLTDRFKSLFGGKSDEPAQTAPTVSNEPESELNCPPVGIRAGASTYAVAAPGKEAVGNDVRFQVTITKTARDCTKVNGEITARIGIQGRVIVGPAGAPPSIEVPIRVAVVQGGIGEKVIATKGYKTTVALEGAENAPFTLVADDVVYPAPPVAAADSYIFYIGFDPQLVSQEKPKPAKKKK
jgi:hypothetical protein